MGRTISKKRQLDFQRRGVGLMCRIGANLAPGLRSDEWFLETPAGGLRITFEASLDGSMATVFSRFEDVARGHYATSAIMPYPYTDCRSNPHSGKWNFHVSGHGVVDSDACFARFEDAVTYLMMLPPIEQLPGRRELDQQRKALA